MIDALHFLRPLWLSTLPAIALAWWLVRRRQSRRVKLPELVAPHLRDALTINRDSRGRYRPVDGIALAMLALAFASAGPIWSRQVAPWFEETAPLVVAIEVTDSMRSDDLLPSRLERARFKVLDLVRARTGARTALIAYAGSAHIIIPPSADTSVLELFLSSLDPAIMPTPGTAVAGVLPLALELLGEEASLGTLLFVNDGFGTADLPVLEAFAGEAGTPSMAALVVGTNEGGVALRPDGTPVMSDTGGRLDTRIDASLLDRAAHEANVSIVRARAGDGDVRALIRAIESNLRQADDPDAEWRDQGWFMLWPALVLSLAWFRRGWTMQW